ncbi:hypothetical protein [Methanocella conradii]|uniref:hypothetical protein n=1 Tax=Methanocella conradii TaxID=1175444 RepID=UPI00157CBCEF|nr:hypothetical protein [Methanocella conradii]
MKARQKIFLVMCVLIISGFILSEVSLWWTYFDISRSSYHFMVRVEGLNKYHGNGSTEVIVPVPIINGKYVYGDEELANRSFGNWTTSLVTVENGKMLVFKTSDVHLTNITAMFERFNDKYTCFGENDTITFNPSGKLNANDQLEAIKSIHRKYLNYFFHGQFDPGSEKYFNGFIENESLNNSVYRTKIIFTDVVPDSEAGDHRVIFNMIFTIDSGQFPYGKSSTNYVLIYDEYTGKIGEVDVKALHGIDNPYIQFITGRWSDDL